MNTDADGLARLRRAFAAAPLSDKPRDDCPPPGRIWEGVLDELPPSELREVIHHVAACAVCTEAWRLAEKLEKDSEENLDQGIGAPPALRPVDRFGWFRRSGAASVAAAAVVVLAVGLEFRDRETTITQTPAVGDELSFGHADLPVGGDGAPVLRAPGSGGIELLSKGPLPREDFVLHWQGPENAESYELTVASAKEPLIPLLEVAQLESSPYRVPPAVLIGLPASARLQVHLRVVGSANDVSGRTFYVEVQ